MLRIANHHISKRVFVLLFSEILVLVLAFYVGMQIDVSGSSGLSDSNPGQFLVSAGTFAAIIIFSMSALGMYQLDFNERMRRMFVRLMPSLALGFCLIVSVFYIAPGIEFDRYVLLVIFAVACMGIVLIRLAFFKSSQFNLFESRVLFLGAGGLAMECSRLAESVTTTHKFDVVGFIATPNDEVSVPAESIIPPGSSLLEIGRRLNVTEIVVSVQNRRGGGIPIKDLLECKLNKIQVTDSATFFEREACQIRVDSLQPSWLVFGNGFDQSFLRAFGKRAFDLVVSLVIALISLPVMLGTALLIYLEDRGPIFYKQERVGRDGKTYWVLKFRSMRNDAESKGAPQWASTRDPRTTRVGLVIRKLRIDELPQILNVVKGEMSFVGPRPERPYFVKQLCEQIPFYDVRHSIKPGITGMAQVRYPYGASVEDAIQKLQYDLYYVKNNSLFLDMLILIDTIQVVLLGKGAR